MVLFFFQGGAKRMVAERKGDAVGGVVNHAVYALDTLLDFHIVSWRDGFIETIFIVCIVAEEQRIQRELNDYPLKEGTGLFALQKPWQNEPAKCSSLIQS